MAETALELEKEIGKDPAKGNKHCFFNKDKERKLIIKFYYYFQSFTLHNK